MNTTVEIVKLSDEAGSGYGVTLNGRLVWAPVALWKRDLNRAKMARLRIERNPNATVTTFADGQWHHDDLGRPTVANPCAGEAGAF